MPLRVQARRGANGEGATTKIRCAARCAVPAAGIRTPAPCSPAASAVPGHRVRSRLLVSQVIVLDSDDEQPAGSSRGALQAGSSRRGRAGVNASPHRAGGAAAPAPSRSPALDVSVPWPGAARALAGFTSYLASKFANPVQQHWASSVACRGAPSGA